ncbi:efflux RND transporter periplasmic adaptor subunit [Shewanella livingstonensis]|uniref:Efflux RND transporter periplasmic adaptor subunit n=1 Tax=Shewanella livingstonensis TaxID=150120 RepID=A0A3G8LY21_9GAMM|nr:efflux RND transporter periplasmic adaptor subunit [Shewanella livingstonensis]AZG73995.1 efflux RND transporter periplasmic adaptor subunit [Shewanella livingstonensis]
MSHLFNTFFLGVILTTMALPYAVQADDVKTLTLAYSEQYQARTYDAKIEAIKAATVSAQTSGRIINIYFDVNDIVPKGAPLLDITNKEQGAGLAGAEAELAKAEALNSEAQAQYARFKALFPKGAISKGAMDEATAKAKSSNQAVSAAQAQLIKAKESLNYTVVSAPFSGRMTQRFVEQGETISYGQALFSGYDTEHLRAVFQVPQQDVTQLQQQAQVSIQLPNGNDITANDINVYQFADPLTHQHQVRVNLDASSLENVIVGQWAKVSVNFPARASLIIPLSAVHQVSDLTSVYRKNDHKIVLNQVRIGRIDRQQNTAEVLSGLMEGDEIVIDAGRYLIITSAEKTQE